MIVQAPAAAPVASAVARAILAGFDRHYALFRYCAQRAKSLFESGDWIGIQRLARERIEYYDARVRECVAKLRAAYGDALSSDAFWAPLKQEFVLLLADHSQPECAETFFNSVCSQVLHRDHFNNAFLFVRPAVATDHLDAGVPSYRCYYPLQQGWRASLTQMMADVGLACPYADLPADIGRVMRAGVRYLRALPGAPLAGFELALDCQLQVLGTLFYRNKGAYLVGRLVNQHTIYPFALPLLRDPGGRLYIDALLFDRDDLTALFSFTRAYFLVDMEVPAAYVRFLRTLIPNKPEAELYTTIGLHKQGKTLFYRDFLHHLRHSHDRFVIAPGIRGMVMLVFTLPSYPYVFKIIRDRIAKDRMDRTTVLAKYQLVKLHDRVGRLADTWEYSQVALPRARVAPALIEELQRLAPSAIEEVGDMLVVKHVYIERRMTPLNLYLQDANDVQLEHGIREYGNAIRELAAANIFPGDMLFKNFGVTRLGRVVFYDYDEIQYMTEMNFRRIPEAPNEEAELASEPWYPVGANDVFPEEFERFLLGDARVRRTFMKEHAALLDADYWQAARARNRRGRLDDIFPYDTTRQFVRTTRDAVRASRK
nr:bifunctional isocitrate dehydrogenase kinase/phosphatase [Pigmentiphaga aceris]